MKKHEGKNMKNNRFSIWKITLSIFTIVMALTLLSTAASASITVYKTPLGTGTPPATERLSGGVIPLIIQQ
jgi:hypothetical protein